MRQKLQMFLINFFVNMVPNMGITNYHNFSSNTDTYDDHLENIIGKYDLY